VCCSDRRCQELSRVLHTLNHHLKRGSPSPIAATTSPTPKPRFSITVTSVLDSPPNGRRGVGGCLLLVWAVAVCGMDAAG